MVSLGTFEFITMKVLILKSIAKTQNIQRLEEIEVTNSVCHQGSNRQNRTRNV